MKRIILQHKWCFRWLWKQKHSFSCAKWNQRNISRMFQLLWQTSIYFAAMQMWFIQILYWSNWTPWDRTIRVTCHSRCLNHLCEGVSVPQCMAHFTVYFTFCVAAPVPNIMSQCEIQKHLWISLLLSALDSQPWEGNAMLSLWSASADTEVTVNLCQGIPQGCSHTGSQPESRPSWAKRNIIQVNGK